MATAQRVSSRGERLCAWQVLHNHIVMVRDFNTSTLLVNKRATQLFSNSRMYTIGSTGSTCLQSCIEYILRYYVRYIPFVGATTGEEATYSTDGHRMVSTRIRANSRGGTRRFAVSVTLLAVIGTNMQFAPCTPRAWHRSFPRILLGQMRIAQPTWVWCGGGRSKDEGSNDDEMFMVSSSHRSSQLFGSNASCCSNTLCHTAWQTQFPNHRSSIGLVLPSTNRPPLGSVKIAGCSKRLGDLMSRCAAPRVTQLMCVHLREYLHTICNNKLCVYSENVCVKSLPLGVSLEN